MQCPLFLAGHWWQHYCVKQHQLLNREPRILLVLVLRVLVMPRDLFFFYYMESINWIIYFFFFSYFFLLFSQIFVPSLGKQGLLAPHVVFLMHNSAFPSFFYPFCFASLFHDYCSPMHHKPYLVHLGDDKASEKWVSKSQSPIDLRSQTLFLYIKEGLPRSHSCPLAGLGKTGIPVISWNHKSLVSYRRSARAPFQDVFGKDTGKVRLSLMQKQQGGKDSPPFNYPTSIQIQWPLEGDTQAINRNFDQQKTPEIAY